MHKIRALCRLIRTETLQNATARRGRGRLQKDIHCLGSPPVGSNNRHLCTAMHRDVWDQYQVPGIIVDPMVIGINDKLWVQGLVDLTFTGFTAKIKQAYIFLA